jgi:hypothetical protein
MNYSRNEQNRIKGIKTTAKYPFRKTMKKKERKNKKRIRDRSQFLLKIKMFPASCCGEFQARNVEF